MRGYPTAEPAAFSPLACATGLQFVSTWCPYRRRGEPAAAEGYPRPGELQADPPDQSRCFG
jgi:hypothetical protein